MAAGALRCGSCGRVQPPGPPGDPFAALGLPRAFALPPGEPERARGERARLVHPDRFARADPRERRHAAEQAARLNDAFRELADALRRAAALLRLLGHAAPDGREPHDAGLAAFLEEQLELRERLAAARSAGDEGAAAAIGAGARARLAALAGELARLFGSAGGAPGEWALREAARLLSRARYHEALAAEAEARDPARAPGGGP